MSKVVEGIVKDIKAVPNKLKAEIEKVDKKEVLSDESAIFPYRLFL